MEALEFPPILLRLPQLKTLNKLKHGVSMKTLSFKQNRTKSIDNLVNQLNKQEGGFQKDERFWKLQPDNAGNGVATIRFMPAPEGEPAPFVKLLKFGFKENGKYYIQNSPNTLGNPDPVAEYNSERWSVAEATNDESIKDEVRKRGRKERYLVNILVINDPRCPENNGKVFLYDMPKTLFGKIKEALKPQFPGDEPCDVFDLLDGKDFVLKQMKKSGFPNYDKSDFAKEQSTVTLDGEVLSDLSLQKIYESLHSLSAEVAPNKFKSYDELTKLFNGVMGFSKPKASKPAFEDDDLSLDNDSPTKSTPKASKSVKVESDDDDDFFSELEDELD